MYVWDVHKLTAQLRKKELDAVDALFYLLGVVTLTSLSFVILDMQTTFDSDLIKLGLYHIVHPVMFAVQGAINILGIIYLWYQNGGAAGKNFIQRYIALIFVLNIRFIVFSFITAFVLFFALSLYGQLMAFTLAQMAMTTVVTSAILTVALELLILYRAGVYLAQIHDRD